MDRLPEGSGFVIAFILSLIFWAYIGLGVWMYLERTESNHIAPANIKARMKYHGVSVAYEDWNGNYYFVRNGKRCEL